MSPRGRRGCRGWVGGGEMITAPRLLTDLCGSELAGDISDFEPTAGGS